MANHFDYLTDGACVLSRVYIFPLEVPVTVTNILLYAKNHCSSSDFQQTELIFFKKLQHETNNLYQQIKQFILI